MKKPQLIMLVSILTMSINLSGQSGIQKTLLSKLSYESNSKLKIDLNGEVQIQEWDKDYIGVEITVSTNLSHQNTLGLLVANDRYLLDTKMDDNLVTTISAPYLKNQVTVNHKPLKENVRYKLFIPSYTRLQMATRNVEELAQVSHEGK